MNGITYTPTWRTIWTTDFRGHHIEGQVAREEDDEIIGRILIDGRRMVGDHLPDLSAKHVYFEFVGGGFLLVVK